MRKFAIEFDDPEEANEWMRAGGAGRYPTFGGERHGFRLRMAARLFASPPGPFRFYRFRHTHTASASGEPVPDLVVALPRSGRMVNRVRDVEHCSMSIAPYWEDSTSEWDGLDQIIVTLDLAGVRRVGAGLSGLEPGAVEFTGWRPLAPSWDGVVASTVAYAENLLGRGEEIATPLVRAEVFRHLTATLLSAFPNTTHGVEVGGRDGGEPATVRRAVEFIDAHAGEDVDLARVAEAARIGSRGLQIAFRRHRDQTPMEYLRRVRLEGAHRDLVAADPTRGETVATVAARWGFAHPGRFSVEYRKAFGRSPSSTLRG